MSVESVADRVLRQQLRDAEEECLGYGFVQKSIRVFGVISEFIADPSNREGSRACAYFEQRFGRAFFSDVALYLKKTYLAESNQSAVNANCAPVVH